ncbi:hypothetical protein AB0885_37085, partial [Streptomyces sp. NPDC005534]|uniref:hypothetical protein n=1 Tax=Streptomyces sp. NPDC005534 TaxID=3155714 RepID=UPI00345739D7
GYPVEHLRVLGDDGDGYVTAGVVGVQGRTLGVHSMLTILGFGMIATFLVLIMLKKMSPIAAR